MGTVVIVPHFELWLIRHGETEWSRSGQHTSRTDLPLLPEGEQKARALRKLLGGHKFALTLSSPLRRALDTSRLAGFDPEIDPDLREWDYGEFVGLTSTQIQERVPGGNVWTYPWPGGETAAKVAARADRVIARAIAAGGDVAIFAHGHLLRVLAARWLGLEPAAGRYFALSTASVSVLG